MHPALLLILISLAGCQSLYAAGGVFAGLNVATLVTVGRTVPDVIYSSVTGRDCSAVRLEQGQSYCRVPYVAARPPFCTRTLGTPNCWVHPDLLADTPTPVADTPSLTAEQIADESRRWPF